MDVEKSVNNIMCTGYEDEYLINMFKIMYPYVISIIYKEDNKISEALEYFVRVSMCCCPN